MPANILLGLDRERLSVWHSISLLALASVVYGCGLVIYRLTLSPLARYPGPKLAAATGWYEVYYELFHKGGGQFPFHVEALHAKYGSIVRINPWELHVNDPAYYNLIYSTSLHHDKLQSMKYRATAPTGIFSTPEHDLHRIRRAALAPYFSKRRVRAYVPYLGHILDQLCYRLKHEYAGKGKVLNLGDMWSSYTADVMTNYAFQKQYRFLEQPDFICPFTENINQITELVPWMNVFTFLGYLATYTPPWLLKRVLPGSHGLLDFKSELISNIKRVKSEKFIPTADEGTHDNLFYELLRSNLPESEKSDERMEHEALGVIGAGIETTKHAATICCFHVLANPRIFETLQKELVRVMPDPHGSIPELSQLEALPYLTACIEEAIRLTYGNPGRSPRTSLTALQFGNTTVPPGIPVSTSVVSIHHNTDLFPQPREFIPERWLDPNTRTYLKGFQVSFGKGTRICVGMNMAYAELYMALAVILRRVDMELFETSRKDVDLARCLFAPRPVKESLGVRVKVRDVLA
ncbi:hypothetical protein DV735_g1056, partial [Chaetothyriales sp. CBS 134920]